MRLIPIALIAAAVCRPAEAQIFHLRDARPIDQWVFGISGFGGIPVGEFRKTEDGGGGAELTIGWQPFRRQPLVLRGNAGFLMYGHFGRDVEDTVCDAFGNCTTETVWMNSRYHNMSFFQLGPELMATDGKWRPFAFALAGTTLFNSWANLGDPNNGGGSTSLFYSRNFSTAYGAGVRLVKQSFGRESGLELALRFTRNAHARSVTEAGVYRRSDGTWDIAPNTGAANVAGIHVGFWLGPYINWNER